LCYNLNINASDHLELLIIDQSLDFKIEKLMDEISKIKNDLPVVLLSNPLKKQDLVKYLKMGISDFIILPLNEKRIQKTLDKFLHPSKSLVEVNNINCHYKDILALELKKSNKGNYPVVFSLIIFDEMNGYKHAEKFLKEIVKDLWDTDQVMFFRKNVLLGIHPFSCDENAEIIKEKFQQKYNHLKSNLKNIQQSLRIETVVKEEKKIDVTEYIKSFEEYL